jgi:hypothetical protein
MVIIGIDPHSTTHVAAAVDEHGQLLGSIQVGASPQQLQAWRAGSAASSDRGWLPWKAPVAMGWPSPECCWRPGSGSWLSPRP